MDDNIINYPFTNNFNNTGSLGNGYNLMVSDINYMQINNSTLQVYTKSGEGAIGSSSNTINLTNNFSISFSILSNGGRSIYGEYLLGFNNKSFFLIFYNGNFQTWVNGVLIIHDENYVDLWDGYWHTVYLYYKNNELSIYYDSHSGGSGFTTFNNNYIMTNNYLFNNPPSQIDCYVYLDNFSITTSPTLGPPSVPTNVNAIAGNSEATITWTPSIGIVEYYTITSSPGGITSTWYSGPYTTNVTGLTNGQSYTFTIIASNTFSSSAISVPSNSVIPNSNPPTAPTNVDAMTIGTSFLVSNTELSSTEGNAIASVSWDASTDPGGSISYYTVKSFPDNITTTTSNTNTTISGLTYGQPYTFIVNATNTDGLTGANSKHSNVIKPITISTPPTNVTAIAGNQTATVSWDFPDDDGGSTIDYFTVNSIPDNITKISITLSTEITGLINGKTYSFTVTSSNRAGTSANSIESNLVTPTSPLTVPSSPTNIQVISGNTRAIINFTQTTNGGSPIYNYRYSLNNGSYIFKGCNRNPIIIDGLIQGNTYSFILEAINIIGNSLPSSSITFTTISPNSYIGSITTIPSPLIQKNPGKLIYFNPSVYIISGNNYVLKDSFGNIISDILININEGYKQLEFLNVIIPYGGINTLSIYNITIEQTLVNNIVVNVSSICFKEGTKILCFINNKELYFPIEKIQKENFIKVYNNGIYEYKQVKIIIKNKLLNSCKKTVNKLFKMSKLKNPLLFEDLYITGSHALLYDKISEKEFQQMQLLSKHYPGYQNKLFDKYKLIAYYDLGCEEINDTEIYDIYHLVIENENRNGSYGIYANGILVESTDEAGISRFENTN
jgi:hypothetical protein